MILYIFTILCLAFQGMDGGAGMVVFDPPVQVAIIVERTITNFAIDGHPGHKARPKPDALWLMLKTMPW